MRAKIGKLIKPAFDAVMDRFDQPTHLETHLDHVQSLRSDAPDALRSQEAFRTILDRLGGAEAERDDLFSRWIAVDPYRPSDPPAELGPLGEVFAEVSWAEHGEATRCHAWYWLDRGPASEAEVAEVLAAFPPKRWFLFKRGVFAGSSVLLAHLVAWAATQGEAAREPALRETGTPALRALVDVLDRLIKHIEVRRNDALGFQVADRSPARSEAEAPTERLRFAMILIEASRVFGDLRYLNTAMKLVDRSLAEQRGRGADARHPDATLAYLFAFCLQEERLAEVLTA